MANVPGLVTDPSQIKGGLVHVQSGGDQDPGLSGAAEPARQLSRHRRDPRGVRPRRPHLRPGAALRQYRLQRDRARPLLAAGRPDGPGRHQHGVPGDVRPAGPAGGRRPRSLGRLSARVSPARPARSARSASARAGGTRCCLPAAAARSTPRSIAGAGSSTAPRRTPRPPRRARRRCSTWSSNLHCPLFGVFGEEDQNPPVALEAELKKRARGRRQGRDDQDLQGRRPRLPRRLPAELPRRPRPRAVDDATAFFKHLKAYSPSPPGIGWGPDASGPPFEHPHPLALRDGPALAAMRERVRR